METHITFSQVLVPPLFLCFSCAQPVPYLPLMKTLSSVECRVFALCEDLAVPTKLLTRASSDITRIQWHSSLNSASTAPIMRPSSREVLTLLLIAIAAGNPTLAAPNYNRSDLALSSAALEARDAAPGFLSDLLGSLGIGRPKSSSPPSPPSHSSPWSPWSPWSPPSHSSPPAPPGPPVGKTIPTHQQNGQSLWGTNRLLPLPAFKSGSGTTLSAGWPWGTRNTRNTNPYTGQPNTGVTRYVTNTQGESSPAPAPESQDIHYDLLSNDIEHTL